MLEELALPDEEIATDVAVGLRITGHLPTTGESQERHHVVQGEPKTWLWKRAGDVRRALRSKHMKSSRPETDEKEKEVRQKLTAKTIQERDNGWATGRTPSKN